MIAILFVAVICAIFSILLFQNADEDQKLAESVQKVAKHKKMVSPFPEDLDSGFRNTGGVWKTTGPVDSAKLIALADRTDVGRMHLKYTKLKPADYKRLQSEPLTDLDVEEGDVTSEDLKEISNIKTLEQLSIRDTKTLTDETLTLTGPPGIRYLGLRSTLITKKKINELVATFPNLDYIDLELNPNLTDEGIIPLKKLKKLQQLRISGTAITDRGCAYIAELPLVFLSMNDNAITDNGIAKMVDMKKLATLNINNTKITDKSLNYFAKMKSLTAVYLFGDRLTRDGLNSLRHKRPDMSVYFERPESTLEIM